MAEYKHSGRWNNYASGRAALNSFGVGRIKLPGSELVDEVSPGSSKVRYFQGVDAIKRGRFAEALVKIVQSALMFSDCALNPSLSPEMRIKYIRDASNSYLMASGIASHLELDRVEKDINERNSALKKHLYEDPASLSSPELAIHLKGRHLKDSPKSIRKRHDARKKVIACKRRTSRL